MSQYASRDASRQRHPAGKRPRCRTRDSHIHIDRTRPGPGPGPGPTVSNNKDDNNNKDDSSINRMCQPSSSSSQATSNAASSSSSPDRSGLRRSRGGPVPVTTRATSTTPTRRMPRSTLQSSTTTDSLETLTNGATPAGNLTTTMSSWCSSCCCCCCWCNPDDDKTRSQRPRGRRSSCGPPRISVLLLVGLVFLATVLRYPALHAQIIMSSTTLTATVATAVVVKTSADTTTTTATTPPVRLLSPEQLATLQQRHVHRRQRIRPPRPLTQITSNSATLYGNVVPAQPDPSPSYKSNEHRLCGGAIGSSSLSSSPSQHWSSLAPLDKNSKVVITNLLSSSNNNDDNNQHNAGVALALQLHQHCQVQHILGMDSLLPNHKYTRMRRLDEAYKRLKRTIPFLEKLVVTVVGLQPFGKGPSLSQQLQSFQPTHIVHLPTREELVHEKQQGDDENNNNHDEDESRSGRLYRRYERLSSLSHLLDALVRAQNLKSQQQPPHVVTFLPDDFLVQEHHILSSTYHALHGVSMTTLQLAPHHAVYSGVGSDDNGVLQGIARDALGLRVANETTMMVPEHSDASGSIRYLHINDVVSGLMAAMQWRQEFSFVSAFTIGHNSMDGEGHSVPSTRNSLEAEMRQLVMSSSSTTPNGTVSGDIKSSKFTGSAENKRNLRGQTDFTTFAGDKVRTPSIAQDLEVTKEWLGWQASVTPHDGAFDLLSSHLSRAFPYGNRIIESRPRFRNILTRSNDTDTAKTTTLPRAFPCASECGYQHQCTASSVYEETFVKVARSATRGCKYAVYMVDLSTKTEVLPPSALPTSGDADAKTSGLCSVAFVSSKSFLAQRIANKAGSDVSKDRMLELSAISKASGWTILFVPGEPSAMTEEELSLPKLSPGKLFSDSVTRAMYVEPGKYPLPSVSVIVETMKLIDAPARGEKRKKIYRSGTTIFRFEPVPPKAARRVVLFGGPHRPPADGLPEKTSEVAFYANQLMQAKGINTCSELRQQVQFYEQTVALVQSKMRRAFLEIRYETFVDFPFQWVNSGMLMHDLREEEGRLLRCEWYDEHNVWGNHGMEDLSLAYILGKRRILERHEPPLEEHPEWSAIRTSAVDEPGEDQRAVDGKYREAEMFIRILGSPIVFPSGTMAPKADSSGVTPPQESVTIDRRERVVAQSVEDLRQRTPTKPTTTNDKL